MTRPTSPRIWFWSASALADSLAARIASCAAFIRVTSLE